uniref:Curli production assembly/transport component CsgE n=1 Tax=Parastrongyloides trichosuri TaxID=131310 RepID=A0A0N5A7H3_PARTI
MNYKILFFLFLYAFSTSAQPICQIGTEIIIIFSRDQNFLQFQYNKKWYESLKDVENAIKRDHRNEKIKEKVLILNDDDYKRIRFTLVPKTNSFDVSDEARNELEYYGSESEEN